MGKNDKLSKRVLAVLGKGVGVGFFAGIVLVFISFLVGMLLYVVGLKWIDEVVQGGITSMRAYLVILQVTACFIATGFFAYKEFGGKKLDS